MECAVLRGPPTRAVDLTRGTRNRGTDMGKRSSTWLVTSDARCLAVLLGVFLPGEDGYFGFRMISLVPTRLPFSIVELASSLPYKVFMYPPKWDTIMTRDFTEP